MTTVQLRKQAMQKLRDNYSIQPLAHIVGMDYPEGYFVTHGMNLFKPHRNFFCGFIDTDFVEELKKGYVQIAEQSGRNCRFELTEKGKKFLESFFEVEIVNGEEFGI